MTYTELNSTNISQGADQLLVYVSSNVPIAIPFLLFVFWFIIAFLTYSGSKRITGRGDLWASSSVAGFLTLMMGLAFSLTPGIISSYVLAFLLIIEVVFVTMFLLSRD